jgi:hypothetical protein
MIMVQLVAFLTISHKWFGRVQLKSVVVKNNVEVIMVLTLSVLMIQLVITLVNVAPKYYHQCEVSSTLSISFNSAFIF